MKNDLGIKHYFPTENNQVYIREMHVKEGYVIDTHRHNYEHYSLLAKGSVIVSIKGKDIYHLAPSVISIEAGIEHKIVALTDVSWFCIHGTNEINETNVDHVLIKEGV